MAGDLLAEILGPRIRAEGPMRLDTFMAIALGHPQYGYYQSRDPLGRTGDFITAPEVSQMFGEMLGIWLAHAWVVAGAPSSVALVELGPGRGTLMADLVRATRHVPGFHAAIEIHLVETSPVLREAQRQALSASSPVWHDSLDTVPDMPLLLVANEFFDALPIRQFQRQANGWHERHVGLTAKGTGLCFVLDPHSSPLPSVHCAFGPASAAPGDIIELCPAAQAIAYDLSHRMASKGGAGLIIDYGHVRSGFGDTLQAVSRHRSVDVLSRPGGVDLTAHVDFEMLAQSVTKGGAQCYEPTTQGAFLLSLGIGERARALAAHATMNQREALRSAVSRLTNDAKMGTLFKVLALTGWDVDGVDLQPDPSP